MCNRTGAVADLLGQLEHRHQALALAHMHVLKTVTACIGKELNSI